MLLTGSREYFQKCDPFVKYHNDHTPTTVEHPKPELESIGSTADSLNIDTKLSKLNTFNWPATLSLFSQTKESSDERKKLAFVSLAKQSFRKNDGQPERLSGKLALGSIQRHLRGNFGRRQNSLVTNLKGEGKKGTTNLRERAFNFSPVQSRRTSNVVEIKVKIRRLLQESNRLDRFKGKAVAKTASQLNRVSSARTNHCCFSRSQNTKT